MTSTYRNLVIASVRARRERDLVEATIETDVESRKGVLCNVKGQLTGTSQHKRGNFVYVGFNGVVDEDTGERVFTDVSSVAVTTPIGDMRVGLPVMVKFDRSNGIDVLEGLDTVAVRMSGSSVQRYNPSDPNNLFLDSGFIKDFLARPRIGTSLTTDLFVAPGQITYNGNYYRWGGGTVSMIPYVTSAGTKAVAQLWYDPVGNTIQVTTSSEIGEFADFTDALFNQAYNKGQDGWLSLEAYEVNDASDTTVTIAHLLRDNRFVYNIASDGNVGYPNPVTGTLRVKDGYSLTVVAPFEVSSGGSVEVGSGASLTILPADVASTNVVRTLQTITSDYTIIADDSVIKVDASSNAVTITLPDAATVDRHQFDIKAVDISNTVTLTTTSSQTIDGSTSDITYGIQYESITVFSDGSNWIIL